ncbi:hypothetical protein MAPG_09311 [Magnaporthiopsis poae ATCC 64411]|uniref:Uncharacterized protein n=1 Tax=Magnaporthiopsis poae (strain ATCC 64411 / 73-15) TaxID=644358 RepID=A0A0C4E9L6_MAGP6|nr:hypothetical protein MAPG_09311 [Magnaporthiopsis poae ATCC 64411]
MILHKYSSEVPRAPDSPDRPEGSSQANRSTARPRSLSLGLSKIFSQSTVGGAIDDAVEDCKGPLGLNLLHEPSDPRADLIFVHGLGGGSRKTWSKTASRSHYWPQEWLPQDPAFGSVRIHSYGYDSDYIRGSEDCLNVHLFGKSFLGALGTSPALLNSRTRIILVGHSMGGLVIKKAYILARLDAAYQDLASRLDAIYFLATPHRGADNAKTLKNLLRVAYNRTYVADLQRNSGAIQVINDEFRHLSDGLELWSFFETQNMKFFSSPIVDPESAILGYREEKQIPLRADHRSICKFATALDVNYTEIRNALASTIGRITTTAATLLRPEEHRDRVKELKKFLDVPYVVDDDLFTVSEARLDSTCQWVSQKESFTAWRDATPAGRWVLWLKGKPASGKSVLSGYVIEQLRGSGQACSYFFFKHGDESKSHLGRCLRSLAFQMGSSIPAVADAMLQLQSDGLHLEHVDERNLWRILFLSAILPLVTTRHYWVIDALDECSSASLEVFEAILSRPDDASPLRIFITSRDTAELGQVSNAIPPSLVRIETISVADTLSDLRRLVESKMGVMAVEAEDKPALSDKIVDKSKGSFLWTKLILKELSGCHSKNEIESILDEVPRGMESLYSRTLDAMSQAPRGKELSKAILRWATCALRPMTIAELNGALNLDIKDSFLSLENSITALCGQFVVVDKLGKIQMVHETAREFLMGGDHNSEFSIKKERAHTRLAQVCLIYLSGIEMKPPRPHRRRRHANQAATRLDFAIYACTAWSYHLAKADPCATDLLDTLELFLKSNVLTWVEAIAESGNLNQLIRTSKNLGRYLEACAAGPSPLEPRIGILRQWTADLTRLPAIFANALTASPSAIFSLIPPFCPASSMMHQTTSPGRKLSVVGALGQQWDDRLVSLDFRQQSRPTALSHGEDFLAVGLMSGRVTLYHATSYQEYKTFEHGESVRFIAFRAKSDVMSTCGMKSLNIWDIRAGAVLRRLASPPRPLAMVFDEDMLLVASDKNYIARWDLKDPGHAEPSTWRWSDGPDGTSPPRRAPGALALTVPHGMLAVAYPNQAIMLWDMKEDCYVGSCGKKLSNGETSTYVVVAMVFNPNPGIDLLVVSYLDGDLALLDPFDDRQLGCFRAEVQSLAPSPDGRLLAAGGAGGVVHVYEFDTLRPLYRVKSVNSFIKQLSFARDSLRFADIRGSQCTVWEPEALLRGLPADDGSSRQKTTTSADAVTLTETVSVEVDARVTAIAVGNTTATTAPDASGLVFCGKDDGTIALYDRRTAAQIRKLHGHRCAVRLVAWCGRRNCLLSVDASGGIILQHHVGDRNGPIAPTVFQTRLQSDAAVVGMLVADAAGKFVLSTAAADHVFNLEDGSLERDLVPRDGEVASHTRRWILDPRAPATHALCVEESCVRVHAWADGCVEVARFSLAPLRGPGPVERDGGAASVAPAQLRNATVCAADREARILLEFAMQDDSASRLQLALLNLDFEVGQAPSRSTKEPDNTNQATADNGGGKGKAPEAAAPATTVLSFTPIPLLDVAHVIGISDTNRVVFLDRSSWVCSADLTAAADAGNSRRPRYRAKEEADELDPVVASAAPAAAQRHFYIPDVWFAGWGWMSYVSALAQRDIVLTRGGDIAVVRGGLDQH